MCNIYEYLLWLARACALIPVVWLDSLQAVSSCIASDCQGSMQQLTWPYLLAVFKVKDWSQVLQSSQDCLCPDSDFVFDSISSRFHFDFIMISFRFRFDYISIVCRYTFDFMSIILRFYIDFTSMALQFQLDYISIVLRIVLRCHSDFLFYFISIIFGVLRINLDYNEISARFHFNFDAITFRIHFDLISITPRLNFDCIKICLRFYLDYIKFSCRF